MGRSLSVPTPADDRMLAEDMAGFRFDPLGHVLYSYPWNARGTELADRQGPWPWQRETLVRIGERLKAGELSHFEDVIREATASGHGIGKSALVSWIVRWALDTREDTRCLVTANTEKQLTTKTWPELTKWHHLGITAHWWTCTATALYSKDPTHERNWRADAVPWSEHNTEAFAGLHNLGIRIVLIFDEASAIADPVWEVAEGALTDVNTEILWCVFGNPTQAVGRFRECFRKDRHRWHCQQIDSRTVPGTNTKQFEEWIQDYGLDSDFAKVRIRGIFPSLGLKSLFSEAEVDGAYGKVLRKEQYDFAPVVLTCDPSWMGDDALTIGKRQGLYFDVLASIPKNDNDVEIAQLLAQYEDEYHADAVFIDAGYGTGIVSVGQTWGRTWQLVWFGETPIDEGCANKRAEMYKLGRNWLRQGGALPARPQLRDDLLGIQLKERPDGKLQLESKKDMKARGMQSPGEGDCFVLSFAYPVLKKAHWGPANATGFAEHAYHPHQRVARRP